MNIKDYESQLKTNDPEAYGKYCLRAIAANLILLVVCVGFVSILIVLNG